MPFVIPRHARHIPARSDRGAIGLAATIGLLWLTDVPLGVPGEWTSPRMPFSAANVWGWIVAAVAAAVYIGFVAAGGMRIESRG